MKKNSTIKDRQLYDEISTLIEKSKASVAQTVNSALTLLYWKIGQRINSDILNDKRAVYGQQIVVSLSRQLTQYYGNSFSEKNLRRMMQFAEIFPKQKIVVSAIRQLSWTHFIALIPIKDKLQRDFYTEMCRVEKWSVKTLREKIDGMLYERSAISKNSKNIIQKEISNLRDNDNITPDIVFKNPYFLNFLGLKDTYSEKDLEDAILQELEYFILELGQGFSFVERQKRMVIDGEDFKLDLLFFHRKLQRLIAVELKLGKFKAAYKGQMELYLRWLEKNEMIKNELPPLGLILCAEGSAEQIELLQLDKSGIKVAEYLTELPERKLLKRKLQEAIKSSQKLIENK
ncbi:PDDEXK nuclease domain-containing protein [Niabella ginsengisoli]|uniref:PDDEXK nuclease domain-containing protein n=1 Tax=Niabella ginsengisoli TaxID=522298 RepID=A0ABS9SH39_9BACT|nr:PDDEXK nuclease domain-containing protein [Niabella ginsengisoli]MCH5597688.1 PDDEXK nuclease domain-containing protein [Niabella ginsengisoli]